MNSWSGGFQGQVVVTDTGNSPLNGWALGWTFAGNEQITSAWNGVSTQSGSKVTVNNESSNGSVPAGGTVTVGFDANGTPAAAPAVTCT